MNFRRIENGIVTGFTAVAALLWVFPLYWALVTSLRSEENVVAKPGLLPTEFNVSAYFHVLLDTQMMKWYFNSVAVAVAVTALVLAMSLMCAYAISQIRFPGRHFLYLVVLASFMIPTQALVVNQFILMDQLKLINTYGGIILPQLIVPVTIIVYKQFFDAVPKEMREAAVLDGAGDLAIMFRLYLPLNWGITTALAIVTFISVWNAFFWPFLVITSQDMMTIPVGITQVNDVFGIAYARLMAVAMLAAMPVVLAYLIFQRRVTEAVMISAGVKG